MKPVSSIYRTLAKICPSHGLKTEKVWITAVDMVSDNPTEQQVIDAMVKAVLHHKQ